MVFQRGHKSGFTGHKWSEESKSILVGKLKGRHLSISTQFKKGHPFLGTLKGIEKMKATKLARTHFHLCPQCGNRYKRKRIEQIYCLKACADISSIGRKLPRKVIKKMIKNHPRGDKVWNWKGGISRNKHYNEKARKWREKVFKRDNYTCLNCGIRSGEKVKVYLEAHHIYAWSDFPKLRYIINNGATLCYSCHQE